MNPSNPISSDLAAQAAAAASDAAERSGVKLAEVSELGDLREVSSVINSIWNNDPTRQMAGPELLRALATAGNYIVGGYENGRMVAALVGFLGFHDGHVQLHSHLLGVLPDAQSKNIGFAMKQHQRAWSLRHGIDTVTWTYDPLVRRNAYFNIGKLGAEATGYYPNFYGAMDDAINAGDESDRILITWRLTSDRAVKASGESLPNPDLESLLSTGAAHSLRQNDDGRPEVDPRGSDTLICTVPEDIVQLRSRNGGLALSWRRALRETLGAALQQGYEVTGFAKEGAYVLTRS